MAYISRAAIINGPARIVRSTGKCHVKESFAVNIERDLFDVTLDGYGVVDRRDANAKVRTSFIPDGRWNAATIAMLWPYSDPTIGSDPWGSSDVATAIHDSDARLYTIIASAVTRMPSIFLSATKTAIGAAEITGVRKLSTGWATADSLFSYAASGGQFIDTAFAPSIIPTQEYTAAWTGKTGFTDIQTEDGWTIDFEVGISDKLTDSVGTVGGRIESVSVLARCKPLGLDAANVISAMDFQGSGTARGKSRVASAADLVITGADGSTVVTLYNASLQRAGFVFGSRVVRDGELAFFATRGFTTGDQGALFNLAAAS